MKSMAIEIQSRTGEPSAFAYVDAAAGRDHDPVELAALRRVVHSTAAAHDAALVDQHTVGGLDRLPVRLAPTVRLGDRAGDRRVCVRSPGRKARRDLAPP
ncbi:MAG TPA: hypothetical protein VLW50_14225 [Streptosporangiaceae bacterium]|nr:hypothetical protein [Streptosporangiaceae bacterium]